MRVNEYAVLADAIERGIEYGWHRAHKHSDEPSPIEIRMAIYDAVMLEVCDMFNFEGETECQSRLQ